MFVAKVKIFMIIINTNDILSVDFVDLTTENDEVCLPSTIAAVTSSSKGGTPANWSSMRLSWCVRKVPRPNACFAINRRPICCYHALIRGFPGLGKKCHKVFNVFEHVASTDTGNC